MAEIQFSRGIKEEVTPDIRLFRAKDGNSGTAKFDFENPRALDDDANQEITGMYLIDEEGEIVIKDVNCRFVNGKPTSLEANYTIKSAGEWDRFIRFMDRYAEDNDLGFTKS
jgi:photosystem II 13kDa protein